MPYHLFRPQCLFEYHQGVEDETLMPHHVLTGTGNQLAGKLNNLEP